MQEDAGRPRQAAGMPRFPELLAASNREVDARWMVGWDSRPDWTHSSLCTLFNLQQLLWQAPPSPALPVALVVSSIGVSRIYYFTLLKIHLLGITAHESSLVHPAPPRHKQSRAA